VKEPLDRDQWGHQVAEAGGVAGEGFRVMPLALALAGVGGTPNASNGAARVTP
jgi:hypothetical protein